MTFVLCLFTSFPCFSRGIIRIEECQVNYADHPVVEYGQNWCGLGDSALTSKVQTKPSLKPQRIGFGYMNLFTPLGPMESTMFHDIQESSFRITDSKVNFGLPHRSATIYLDHITANDTSTNDSLVQTSLIYSRSSSLHSLLLQVV